MTAHYLTANTYETLKECSWDLRSGQIYIVAMGNGNYWEIYEDWIKQESILTESQLNSRNWAVHVTLQYIFLKKMFFYM